MASLGDRVSVLTDRMTIERGILVNSPDDEDARKKTEGQVTTSVEVTLTPELKHEFREWLAEEWEEAAKTISRLCPPPRY